MGRGRVQALEKASTEGQQPWTGFRIDDAFPDELDSRFQKSKKCRSLVSIEL
jgi:hypothetical protein